MPSGPVQLLQGALQGMPHLGVALGGPGSWIADTTGLVEGAADVERQAVVEDHPAAVFRQQHPVGVDIHLAEGLSGGDAGLRRSQQVGHERSRAVDGARSEEHTSEHQSLMRISYAVFCLKTKKHKT